MIMTRGMEKLGELVKVDFEALANRAANAPEGDDGGFQARQDEIRRADHLRRADPAILEEDVALLRYGRLDESYRHLMAVKAWWLKSYPVLCLAGSKGTGKTLAACWAIAEEGGVYVTASEFAAVGHGAVNNDYRKRAQWDALLTARVAVLDDLATEQVPPTAMEPLLFQFIHRRQARGRRTILTTNQTQEQLHDRYPEERLWSRLMRSWVYVRFTGPDMREAT